MASNNFDYFDKFCNMFPDSIPMKQIVELALIGKVISSYKIDSLTSFHDQLMSGLWKKSSNGRIYPLDNRLEEILYVEINENFEPNFEKSLEKLRNFSVAPNVFDEMPGNELVKSDTVQVENGQTDSQAVVDQVFDEITEPNPHLSDTQMEGVDDAHMFDTMPIPDFIIEMAQAAKITQENSTGGSDELGSDDVSVDYGPPRDITRDVHIGCDLIEGAQLLSAHEVSDEMLQAYSNSPAHSDFESTSCNVRNEHREFLDYQRHMFAKLATLNGSLFQHFISIGANEERFSTLRNALLDVSQLSHQILLNELVIGAANFRPDYQLYSGTFLSCCDLVQVNLTSQGLNSMLSCNLVHNLINEIIPRIFIYDPGDTIYLILTSAIVFNSTTTILGVRTMAGDVKNFDPGIISVPLLFCCFTLEDDKVYVVYTWELCNVVALWCRRVPCLFCVFAIKVPNAKIISEHRVIEVGSVGFRGQQALGRNNVNWILFDALTARNEDTVLLEFLCGVEGLISYSNMGISIDEDMNHKILLLPAGTFLGSTARVYTLSLEICALCESIKMRTDCNCELGDAVIHIFDPGGLCCQCDCMDCRRSLDFEEAESSPARRVLLLETMLEEEWFIVLSALPLLSVVEFVASISSVFDASLGATIAGLNTTLSKFGSAIHQNQRHSPAFNLLELSQDPRFCALPHGYRQVAIFAEIVDGFVCYFDEMMEQGCHLDALIALSYLTFFIGEDRGTKRVLYKRAMIALMLKWWLHLLLVNGLYIYDDIIFVFDPTGLLAYLRNLSGSLLKCHSSSLVPWSTCDP